MVHRLTPIQVSERRTAHRCGARYVKAVVDVGKRRRHVVRRVLRDVVECQFSRRICLGYPWSSKSADMSDVTRRALPAPQVTDRSLMWRLGAVILMVAALITIFEAAVCPPNRRTAVLLSAIPPVLLGLAAWKICPKLAPRASFATGRTMLILSCIPVVQMEITWRSTPVAGAAGFFFASVILFAASFFNPREVYETLLVIGIGSAFGLLPPNFSGVAFFTWTQTMIGLTSIALFTTRVVGRMRSLSYDDSLTGALNRRGWDMTLQVAEEDFARANAPLSVLVADIDSFKEVNDAGGHDAGDQLLVKMVAASKRALRKSDALARLGGDEFAVVLSGCNQADAVRLANAVLSTLLADTGRTCSIGVATVLPGEDTMDLVGAADRAMYLAKASGRACVRALLVGQNSEAAVASRHRMLDGDPVA
jgi:diguanylate cyclase (GGDEF)-like protein